MNSLQIFVSKLQSVVNEWDSLTVQAIEETKENAVNYNRGQMMDGFTSDNKEIGGYASLAYEQLKQELNPFANGRVDLNLTGAFQKAMDAKITGNMLLIDSNDSKRNKLVEKYGKKIFGLTEKNQKRYKKDVNLYLFRLIKNKIK